jgi:hypothetical protein
MTRRKKPPALSSGSAVTIRSDLAVRLVDVRAQIAMDETMAGQLREIDDALHGRVSGRLDELLEECKTAIEDVEAAAGTADEWKKLRAAKRKALLLSRETLAFTEGALARRSHLDVGFCALADKLLDYFNTEERKLNWRGFTILAETSFFGEVAEVVRLRFPEVSIWHLPVTAHEFGHYANPTIQVEVRDESFWESEYPVRDYLRKLWNKRNQEPWFHAHELMADAFAAYALGPAYAYCMLLLGPDPGALGTQFGTHPSWYARYDLIIETLRRIAAHGGATTQIVNDIELHWETLRAAGAGEVEPDTANGRKLLDLFYPMLDAGLRGVRYTTFGRAQELAPMLAGRGQGPFLDKVTIPDLVNAAWLARLDDLENSTFADEIANRAVAACRGL